NRDRLFQILAVEVNRLGWLRRLEDSTDGQLQIRRPDSSHQYNSISDLPSELFRQLVVNNRAGAVVLPGIKLVLRNLKIGVDLEQLLRIGRELREEMLGLVVDVLTTVPLRRHDGLHALYSPDLLRVINWQRERERNAMTRDQTLRRLLAAAVDIKCTPD